MKHAALIALTLIALTACLGLNACWAGEPGWAASVDEALRLGKQQNRPIMIEFTTPICGPCRKMEMEVFTLRKVKTQLAKFVKTKADITQPDLKALSKSHGFSAVPAFVFMRPNGTTMVARQDLSPALPDDFLRCVKDVLKHERTLQSALKMAAMTPDSPKSLYRLGVAYADACEHALARQQFEKLVAAKPTCSGKELAHASYRLAKIYADEGQRQKALSLLDTVIENDPKNKEQLGAPALVTKGELVLANGDWRTAYKCFDRVIKRMNTDKETQAKALYYLGKGYQTMGNRQAAVYTWKRGAQMYPSAKHGKRCKAEAR